MPEEAAERAHLLELRDLLAEVGQRERVPAQLFGGTQSRGLVGLGGDLLDQREDVAEAQKARGRAIGMEELQLAHLLTRAHELQRLADDRRDRKRGTSPGVAVRLREDHAREREPRGEGLRRAHGILARHRIGHEEDLVGLGRVANPGHLVHQDLVDVKATRRVHDRDVVTEEFRVLHRGFRALDGVRLALRIERHEAVLLCERAQLLRRGGPLDVRGNEEHLLAKRGLQVESQLRGRRRLARTLKTHEEDHRGALLESQGCLFAPEDARQLVPDDLDDLLRRRERGQDLSSDGFLPHPGREILDDLEVDVRFEESRPDLLERFVHMELGEVALAAKLLEDALETI